MRLVAGVDSSTQSTKVELRDADGGGLVGAGRAPHPIPVQPAAEQDPRAWWEAFELALGEALVEADTTVDRLEAISVAGQQHGLVPLDAEGAVLRPARLWCDTTSAPDAAWLVDQHPGGASGWAQACGSVPVAAFTIAKLSWLHRSDPEAWRRLARVLLPHDWLTSELTATFSTDRGEASGTGYWSPAGECYRWDLLSIVDPGLDWPAMVPTVLGPIDVAGEWRPPGGSGHTVVVAPGTGDNMASALGLGLAEGDLVVSIGTSGTVFANSPTPTADPSARVAGFANASGGFLPLVCTMNATRVTDAIARICGLDHSAFDDVVLEAEAGAGGLTVLPYFDGERTPDRPDATGVISGLRSDVSSDQLARAAVEGVVCALLDGLDALLEHVRADGTLHVVGGGARSAGYRQVLADLSNRAVRTTSLEETVATGACVQAAATLDRRDLDAVRADWSGVERATFTEPSLDGDRVEEIRARYRALRDRT